MMESLNHQAKNQAVTFSSPKAPKAMFRIATRVNGDEHAADELGSRL
jgi:hypothetical protein